MKWRLFVLSILLLPALASAQDEAAIEAARQIPINSPFEHLAGQFLKTASVPHSICPKFLYYQNGPNPSYAYLNETLPFSSEWAIKIPIPASTQASVCTVWTQMVDFELLNTTLFNKDTIRFYVRNATAPYNILYSTYFIARQGQNQGVVEVEQPLVPPFTRPVISPARDILLGYKVVGDSGHVVKWRFTTPALFSNPPMSFKVTPSGLIPVSTAVGQSVDWINEAQLCCNKWVPVELSAFNARVENDVVLLQWRTETETNNYHFQIERALSPDGPWESRAYVPGFGTTTQPRDYQHKDRFSLTDFAGRTPVYWYRLRQHDFDGTISMFPPIQVHLADLSPLGFELMPVYPNPLVVSSSQLARIRYRVPDERHVRISVHDMLGRELAVVTNNIHPAGMYEGSWAPLTDNGAVNSGTYIVRMSSGGTVLTTNVSVVR
jgi:hypothetical protein